MPSHTARVLLGILTAALLCCCGCGLFHGQDAPTPENAPRQYFFPHGHQGQMLLWRDYVIRAASWTRGDGIAFFRIGKNGTAHTPEYFAGLISAGYVTDMCILNNILYITTNYSVQTIALPKDGGEPYLLENMFIAFPNGGINKIAAVNGKIYITAGNDVREYSVSKSGRLLFNRIFCPDAKNISVMRGHGDFLFIARKPTTKDAPSVVTVYNRKDGSVKKIDVPIPVENILFTPDGSCYFKRGRDLVDSAGKPAFAEKLWVSGYTQLQNDTIGVLYEPKRREYAFAIFDGKKVTDVACGPVNSNTRFLFDGNYFGIWTGNQLKCNNFAKMEKDGFYSIPVIYTEATVIYLRPYVYSIDCSGGEYSLYGFDSESDRPLGAPLDVRVAWRKKSERNFRYDIVLPPYDLQRYGKWLFAPEALLDVSNPGKPKKVADIDFPASCVRFDEARKLAFFAQDTKLSVKSIVNLPEMTDVAEIPADKVDMPQWTSFEIQGKYLYGNARSKIVIYDISDIKKPVKVSSLPLNGGNFYQIAIHGTHLYAMPYSRDKALPGLLVIDVADAKNPKIVSEMTEYRGCSVNGVKIYKGKLYLANGISIRRYSLENPSAPKLEKCWIGPDRAMQSYLYMDVRDGGLVGKKYPRFDFWRIEE